VGSFCRATLNATSIKACSTGEASHETRCYLESQSQIAARLHHPIAHRSIWRSSVTPALNFYLPLPGTISSPFIENRSLPIQASFWPSYVQTHDAKQKPCSRRFTLLSKITEVRQRMPKFIGVLGLSCDFANTVGASAALNISATTTLKACPFTFLGIN